MRRRATTQPRLVSYRSSRARSHPFRRLGAGRRGQPGVGVFAVDVSASKKYLFSVLSALPLTSQEGLGWHRFGNDAVKSLPSPVYLVLAIILPERRCKVTAVFLLCCRFLA